MPLNGPISNDTTGTTAGTESTFTIRGNRLIWQSWNTTTSATMTDDNTWERWVTLSAGTTAATTTGPDATWAQWTSAATNGTTSGPIWIQWLEEGQPVQARPRRRPHIEVDPRVEAEARVERQRRNEERRRQDEERRQQEAEANERAMGLLREVLNDQQNRDLAEHEYFFVQAASGRLYRIGNGRVGNVKVVDPVTKVWTESLCIHQRMRVPHGDTMLMQKLLIETAEELFRSHANISLKNGGFDRACGGLLTADRLAEVIPFPLLERAEEAA